MDIHLMFTAGCQFGIRTKLFPELALVYRQVLLDREGAHKDFTLLDLSSTQNLLQACLHQLIN